jgi:hypothetical protein
MCIFLGLAGYALHFFTKDVVRKLRTVTTEHLKLSVVCVSIVEKKNLTGGAINMTEIDFDNLVDVRKLLEWSTAASYVTLTKEGMFREKK